MYIIIIRNSYNIVNILQHFIDILFYVYDTIAENILLSKNLYIRCKPGIIT